MGRNVLDAFLALLGALDLVLLAVGERPAVGARAQQGRRERRAPGACHVLASVRRRNKFLCANNVVAPVRKS